MEIQLFLENGEVVRYIGIDTPEQMNIIMIVFAQEAFDINRGIS